MMLRLTSLMKTWEWKTNESSEKLAPRCIIVILLILMVSTYSTRRFPPHKKKSSSDVHLEEEKHVW